MEVVGWCLLGGFFGGCVMYDFDPADLQRAARRLADEWGVEKTPGQLAVEFRGLIASYRRAAREAGRHVVAILPDNEIWDRIRILAGDA